MTMLSPQLIPRFMRRLIFVFKYLLDNDMMLKNKTINYIKPTQEAMNDRPYNRVISTPR